MLGRWQRLRYSEPLSIVSTRTSVDVARSLHGPGWQPGFTPLAYGRYGAISTSRFWCGPHNTSADGARVGRSSAGGHRAGGYGWRAAVAGSDPFPQDQDTSLAVLPVSGSDSVQVCDVSMFSVASSSGRSRLRSPPAVPTVSPSADPSVSPAPSNGYALPARVETGCLPSVDVLDSSSTPVCFEDGSTQPPIRSDVPTSGNLSGYTVGVVMFWHPRTRYAPRSFSRVPFRLFMPTLLP